jgi:hypothetical protein
MAANQVAAVQGLKQIATGQETFRRQSKDWIYPGHTTGIAEYANRYAYLFKIPTQVLGYVDETMARASVADPDPTPRTGYFVCDTLFIVSATAGPQPVDFKYRYGVYGFPAQYNLSGMDSYYLDYRGQVWMGDARGAEAAVPPVAMAENPADIGFAAISE